MFDFLEKIIIPYSETIHLAIFAPVISFIEEVIPPIPSPSIMLATGYMAQIQGYLFYSLIILAILGALGKTGGAAVVYYIADKVEDLLSSKIAKFIGVTHEQIESLGKRLSKDKRDYVILTALRATPLVPSSLLSVGCGLLKVDFKLFMISTFFGSIIRDFIYIYLGYTGTRLAIHSFKNNANTIESIIQYLAVILIILFLGFLYYRRYQNNKVKK
jgi:membrane protein DedA with SNARE-associated domain